MPKTYNKTKEIASVATETIVILRPKNTNSFRNFKSEIVGRMFTALALKPKVEIGNKKAIIAMKNEKYPYTSKPK